MAVASEHLNRSGLKSGSDQSYVPVFFVTLGRGGLGPSYLKRLTN